VHEHAPQAQLELHVSVPYVLHCMVAWGVHVPVPEQLPLDQLPVESHVSVSVPQLPHDTEFVCPGAHTPLHAPLMHVWFGHVDVVCHIPLVHVCALLPEHCFCPVLHDPVHIPPTHVPLVQGSGLPYCPQAPHVSTPLPEHCAVCGVHTGVDGQEHVPHAQLAVQVCVP